MKHLSLGALALLFACKHDADELKPNSKDDLATWLEVDEACATCLAARCTVSADACLNEPLCRLTMTQCSPPNPGCSGRSPETRDMANCVLDACKTECGLPAQAETCLGNYDWLAPQETGPVAFQVRLRQFMGFPWDGLARVMPCSGPTPMCDEARAVELREEGTADAEYNFLVTQARPYFRVTGPGLRTMLFYEDGVIAEGTQLNIPALSETVYGGLTNLLGAQPEQDKGTLDASLFDCNGDWMAGAQLVLKRNGVVLTGSELGVPYYFDEQFPRLASVQTQTSRGKGQGGFVNLQPGVYDLLATVNGVTFARVESLLIEAGIVTHVNLMPRSRDEAL